MFTLDVILIILIGHWYADFVSQNDWMAKNKSKDNVALGLHVLSYTSCISIPLLYALSEMSNSKFPAALSCVSLILINMVLHFCTDYVTSRINSKLWERKDIHNFFVSVGFDQLIHYTTLFGSIYLFVYMGWF